MLIHQCALIMGLRLQFLLTSAWIPLLHLQEAFWNSALIYLVVLENTIGKTTWYRVTLGYNKKLCSQWCCVDVEYSQRQVLNGFWRHITMDISTVSLSHLYHNSQHHNQYCYYRRHHLCANQCNRIWSNVRNICYLNHFILLSFLCEIWNPSIYRSPDRVLNAKYPLNLFIVHTCYEKHSAE